MILSRFRKKKENEEISRLTFIIQKMIAAIYQGRTIDELTDKPTESNCTRYTDLMNAFNTSMKFNDDGFIDLFRKHTNDLFTLIKKLKTTSEEIILVQPYATNIDEVDANNFTTQFYQNKFKTFLEKNVASDKEIIQYYNDIKNEDSLYLTGIEDSMSWAKYKKNKNKAIYLQIADSLLTDYGKKVSITLNYSDGDK